MQARFLDISAAVIDLSGRIVRTAAGRYIADQLVRAVCSAGANYQESRGAESRADFLHKLQLVLKELRESAYWLALLERTRLARSANLPELAREADELVRILVRSIVTAKGRGRTSDT